MTTTADIWVRMACLTLLRVGFCRQTMAVANPGECMIFWLVRMTLDTRRIFVTHAASLRVRTISKSMLLLIISGVVGWIRRRLMAHDAIFGGILTVVADKTVFHLRVDHVSIEVFPLGNAGVATAAFELFMLFMGKNEVFSEASAGTHCLAGFLEMTKAAVALFAGFEVTFKAALFAGASESIVNFDLLRKNTANA